MLLSKNLKQEKVNMKNREQMNLTLLYGRRVITDFLSLERDTVGNRPVFSMYSLSSNSVQKFGSLTADVNSEESI